MPRLEVLKNEDLPVEIRSQVEQMELAGEDTTNLRIYSHRADMLLGFMSWYYPAHDGGVLSPKLKETVRLYISQLNDCSA